MKRPIIFISYSHKDEREKNRLVTQIKVLKRAGKIDLWNDDLLRAGKDWKREIDEAMTRAQVAILLITANFLTSNFILDVEVPELIERHKKAGLDIFPIIARDCAWQEVSWLNKMNVRPRNGMPVWRSNGRYADSELAKIAREIAEIIKDETPDKSSITSSKPVIAVVEGTLHKNLEDAIETINSELDSIRRSDKLIDIFAIDEVICTAISYGAPLYNQGGIIDCAEIYAHTIKSLINLIDESNYGSIMPMMQKTSASLRLSENEFEELFDNRDMCLEIAYSEFKEAAAFLPITNKNAMKAAWRIRYIFDQIRFIAEGVKEIDIALRSFGLPNKPFTDSIEKLVKLAIFRSDIIYEQGLMRGKDWIKACATIYLYTTQIMSSMLPMTKMLHDKASLESAGRLETALENIMPDRQFITDKNAYEVAWKIRHILQTVLNLSITA